MTKTCVTEPWFSRTRCTAVPRSSSTSASFAGREVTQAEIDRLAQQLLEELESFEIVSEQRHQIDHSMEASVTWSGSQAPRAGGSTSH
jgi:hypothetical protein